MRTVLALVGSDRGSVFGTTLIALGLVLMVYSAGMQAGLLPGGRVVAPRPPALDRPRTTEERPALADAPSPSVATLAADEVVGERGAAITSRAPIAPADAADRSLIGDRSVADGLVQESGAPLAGSMDAADARDGGDTGSRPPPGRALGLQIPRITIDTEVVPAGMTATDDGNVEWETVPFVAAHYLDTALIGDLGNAVISGHVVTLREGNVFRNLYQIDFDDEIKVQTENARFTYIVKDLKLVEPTAVEVMAPTQEPRLTLITCGGEFDPRTRQFSHRLIVTAELADWALL